MRAPPCGDSGSGACVLPLRRALSRGSSFLWANLMQGLAAIKRISKNSVTVPHSPSAVNRLLDLFDNNGYMIINVGYCLNPRRTKFDIHGLDVVE